MHTENDNIDATSIKAKLEEEIAFRNKLISILSHEAKGMMANVFWMIEAMENGTSSPEMMNDLLPELRSVADKNLASFTDTLQWIKMQDKSFSLNKVSVNAYDLFLDLKNEEKQRLLFEGEQTLHFTTDKNLLKLALKKIIGYLIKFCGSEKDIILDITTDTVPGKAIIKIKTDDADMDKETLKSFFSDGATSIDNINSVSDAGLLFAKDIIFRIGANINVQHEIEQNMINVTITL